MTTLNDNPVSAFRASFLGVTLEASDADYEEVRRVHNGLIDRRPVMIARCRNTADVVDAVNFARKAGLEIAVRGGGHNVAGLAVADGGMMIDLSPMKAVLVDPDARIARAQPGVTWSEFNRETQLHGLATTGGVISSTGIAGLTLGGGLGWLMSQYGMAVDNLVAAEVVTASGEALRASADQNPELFWAIRGGGGNFGIVTAFEYQLHPVGPMVIGGLIAYPLAQAGSVVRSYRDFTRSLPDDLNVFAALTHAPDGSGIPLCGLLVCYTGDPKQADALIEPLKGFGTPAAAEVGPIPYSALNSMLDDAFPRGALNYWKAQFLQELSDEAIDLLVGQFEQCPSPMTNIVLEHFHGAVTRVPVDETAFPHRTPGFNAVLTGQWMDPSHGEATVEWVRDTHRALEPHLAPNRYANYLASDEGDQLANAYGPALTRLRRLKTQYDPGNLFHLNLNIAPEG